MANSIWQATVQNATGDIIPGAEMTVVDENTGLPATIFSSIGGAALTNPFFADSEGFAQFYAASGTYRVTANDTGTGQSITWRYIRFGDAASRDVGTASGNIPDADDLNMVGNTNYTSGNLNPNVFGGDGPSDFLMWGWAENANTAVFEARIFGKSSPISITQAGLFNIFRPAGFTSVATNISVTIAGSSSPNSIVLTVAGLSGLTAGESLLLYTVDATSKITVNF